MRYLDECGNERAVVDPRLRDAVMIVAFEGWNDAGEAATAAVDQLISDWKAEHWHDISPEEYVDFQVSRPQARVDEFGIRHIDWPVTSISYCVMRGSDFDVLLVRGVEPNFRWSTFCDGLLSAATYLGVSSVISLGALLADVPHTRPIQVTATAGPDPRSQQRFSLPPSTYEGPTGITGVLAHMSVERGLATASLWAAVPHYVSQGPSPKVTLALLHRLEELLDIEVPLGELPEAADAWESEVSQIAADDDEITHYIQALEERDEQEEQLEPTSGEAIAADFERYLRRRGPGAR